MAPGADAHSAEAYAVGRGNLERLAEARVLVREAVPAMYAYRIDIGVLSFGLAGLLVLGIAMMTVSGQILRVARTNPVEALRYE